MVCDKFDGQVSIFFDARAHSLRFRSSWSEFAFPESEFSLTTKATNVVAHTIVVVWEAAAYMINDWQLCAPHIPKRTPFAATTRGTRAHTYTQSTYQAQWVTIKVWKYGAACNCLSFISRSYYYYEIFHFFFSFGPSDVFALIKLFFYSMPKNATTTTTIKVKNLAIWVS